MNKVHQGLLGLVLASMGVSASAGLHHICYEASPLFARGITVLRMVVACDDDSGSACTISAPTMKPDRVLFPLLPPVQGPRNFALYERELAPNDPPSVRLLEADIQFGSTTRTCRIQAQGALGFDPGPTGSLTGFSTDASGLVTTGVWRLDAKGSLATMKVPEGFTVVGGGGQAGTSALLWLTRFETAHPRGWYAGSKTPLPDSPDRTTGFAVGMQIGRPENPVKTPVPVLWVPGRSAAVATSDPSAQVQVPKDSVVLGGDLQPQTPGLRTDLVGQFATVSAPVSPAAWLRCVLVGQACHPLEAVGWQGESKDDGRFPGELAITMKALPRIVTVDGVDHEVRGKMVSATSAVGPAPAVDVGGLRGEYAVTGAGAELNWRPFNTQNPAAAGTRLTRIEPRPDWGGASVEAGPGASMTPASITGYALGIKLVPKGTPAEPERPRADLPMDVTWMCRVAGEALAPSRMCLKYQGWQLTLGSVCTYFSDLPKFGYCKP